MVTVNHSYGLVRYLVVVTITVVAVGGGRGAAEELPPSRAAWWLEGDRVEPIADFVNAAEPGRQPKFVDRIGGFQVNAQGRALEISGEFPEANIWRFDLTTFDNQFDMRRLYVPYGKCAFPDDQSIGTRRVTQLLGDAEKGRTYTGPWEIFMGKWLVPTARVALDGKHIYTSWFDLPSIEDQAAGRVYTSFALDIMKPGRHTVRVSFDDFVYGTRWRPRGKQGETKPPVTTGKNELRPHHIGSIAIGVDERVRDLKKVNLKPLLRGARPRLSPFGSGRVVEGENLSVQDVESMIQHVDPDRGELWEYSIDAESMASENDMDAGRKGLTAAVDYDAHVAKLSPAARAEWDRYFRKRFQDFYTFFVFQRNYHPTGYAQNHSSATVIALLGAGIAWDGPEAEKWLNWGVMTCRKRVQLYGRDGGVEWMNEARSYGLNYFQKAIDLTHHGTGIDLTRESPFFKNEWRYALHHAAAFPIGDDRRPDTSARTAGGRKRENRNVPVPSTATRENTPTDYHFDDVDQVFVRSDWGPDAFRARLWAGSVFGKHGAPTAKRYNWAHCRVNQGSFVLARGPYEIIAEAGASRTYRKGAGSNNCILVNDSDQWGGGQVWHPKLQPDQISRITMFADGDLMSCTRADCANAYPPAARLKALSRCLIHVKPDLFLLFDRVETGDRGRAEWRYHAAYIEPQSGKSRFTAFGYEPAGSAMRNRAEGYEDALRKLPDVRCQVALLTPGARASVKMSDVYYRWSPFSRPTRHLRIVQEGDGPVTLLTAFGPEIPVTSSGNTYQIKMGDVGGAMLVGEGTAGRMSSDAYFSIAVENRKTRRTEVMRFGGTRLEYGGVAVDSSAEDVFAAIDNGKVRRVVETLR